MEITITKTPLEGILVIDTKYFRDERGFFIENYHKKDFAKAGITAEFVQDNHSRSSKRVLRGLHYQNASAPMGKLIRCTMGAIFDVAVDIRVGSLAFGKWFAIELNDQNMKQIYVPPGFAHGFATISDIAEVQYKCTAFYTPSSEGAIIWNDPDIGIKWPYNDPILSKRDANNQTLKQYLQKPAFFCKS